MRSSNCGIGLLLLVWALVSPLTVAADARADAAQLPRPSTHLQPGEVVRIVIDALAHNDVPYADAGIETTFHFASPANRVVTGPLDRFTRMVKSPTYGIMVNHIDSEFSEVVFSGNRAYQMVRLTAANGLSTVFAFRLGKQLDGEFKDMWMTEAVWPVAEGEASGQAL
ncbi:MAG TPA: DUF4864 domain-containing protein [Gammaproteobacteria bacterium]|jgi:hypothetical protein